MRTEPGHPAAAPPVCYPGVVGGDDCLVPLVNRRHRICCSPVEFGVTLAKQGEGVFVRSEPDVQAVFLDASVAATAGRALAAQPPATLVHRDRIEAITPAGFTEPPGCTQPRHAAPEDGDFAPGPSHPSSVRARANSGQLLSSGNRLSASISGCRAGSPHSSKSSAAARNSKIRASWPRAFSTAAVRSAWRDAMSSVV